MMTCFQVLLVCHAVALAVADRDTGESSELAVQSSAAFLKANATLEEEHIVHLRHRPASTLQKSYHRHRHRSRKLRDNRQEASERYDQVEQSDQGPPPEPRPRPPWHAPGLHARPYSPSELLEDEEEPLAFGPEGDGLQMFSRSRQRQDAALADDISHLQEDALAMTHPDDMEDFAQRKGRHDRYQPPPEPTERNAVEHHRDTPESHAVEDSPEFHAVEDTPESQAVEDISESHAVEEDESDIENPKPRREQEGSRQVPTIAAQKNTSPKLTKMAKQSQAMEPHVQGKISGANSAQPVHLAHQSPPVSSEPPQTVSKNIEIQKRPVPRFGSIDLNGDGFIDGVEFQEAKTRGAL